MSTHNIGFYEDLTKIIFQLSSNTHLISSSGYIQKRLLIKINMLSQLTGCPIICLYQIGFQLRNVLVLDLSLQ